jgi:hypothetical protein
LLPPSLVFQTNLSEPWKKCTILKEKKMKIKVK